MSLSINVNNSTKWDVAEQGVMDRVSVSVTESYFWSPEPLGLELSRMVALRRRFEPKHFPIREMIQTPLTLHSGGGLGRLEGEFYHYAK